MEGGEVQVYNSLIESHRTRQFVNARSDKLMKIRSYHFFKIHEVCVKNQTVKIIYRKEMVCSLNDLIDLKIQLLPSHIKNIIWQITKVMVQGEINSVNHFRLCPKAIAFTELYDLRQQQKPLFLQVKDYSMGKQFKEINDGKLMHFFQYMHPNLSIYNQTQNFDKYLPKYDIWSLGIILYKLIYFISPFVKQQKKIFSKTVLRKYLIEDYEFPLYNKKFESINNFIKKCVPQRLKTGFQNWKEIQQYICRQQQIYTSLDFMNKQFNIIYLQHVKIMYLFSSIYTMIIDQCNSSPHPFWSLKINQNMQPFAMKIAETAFVLMIELHSRFKKIYGSHMFLLKSTEEFNNITQSIEAQIKFINKQWSQPKFRDKFSLATVLKMRQICAKAKLQILDKHQSRLTRSLTLNLTIEPNSPQMRNQNDINSHFWRLIERVYVFSHELITILNVSRNRMKLLYELPYTSIIFHNMAITCFHFPVTEEIQTNIYVNHSELFQRDIR